jgi:hypothetical protein
MLHRGRGLLTHCCVRNQQLALHIKHIADADQTDEVIAVDHLRIPTQSGHCFQSKAATDSDLIRPPIPTQSGQSDLGCDRVRWVILTGVIFAPFEEERRCPGRDYPCAKYTMFCGCMPADCRNGELPSV